MNFINRWIRHSFLVNTCQVCQGEGRRVKILDASSQKYRRYSTVKCEYCTGRGFYWKWS